jgi:hypothetical protein
MSANSHLDRNFRRGRAVSGYTAASHMAMIDSMASKIAFLFIGYLLSFYLACDHIKPHSVSFVEGLIGFLTGLH